ncbi:hypothetical protein OEZ85_000615 [Tetradesmus obliquus]|uniref:Right handed beta helix domain-containing protein n=1 Tax=Tetradesmus obliquus TaxID=3088 RepID=A0ABY8UJ64_TETOB|nr:hypothetical protein OEZ85_000615 [Tetradesmus obliquus]
MAFNSGGSAGGAVFLQASNITFNAAASMTDNKLVTCNDLVWTSGACPGGGAIFAIASNITHNAAAVYRNNTAADCNGGALSLTSGSVCLHTDHSDMTPECMQPSRFEATQLITFKGNSVSMKWQSAVAGGAAFLQDSFATFIRGASFVGNAAPPEGRGCGGALCALSNSSVTFSAKTS